MLALTSLPPNTGHFSKIAYFMPGTVTSMPNSGLPSTTSGLSTPGTDVPMILKSFGSLSWTAARSGGGELRGRRRELGVAEPTPARRVRDRARGRRALACRARPRLRRGLDHHLPARPRRRGAAAPSSAASRCCRRRTAARTWRRRRAPARSAPSSNRRRVPRRSASAATVLTPWPISGFLAMIVTTPSGMTRIKALSIAASRFATPRPARGSARRSRAAARRRRRARFEERHGAT